MGNNIAGGDGRPFVAGYLGDYQLGLDVLGKLSEALKNAHFIKEPERCPKYGPIFGIPSLIYGIEDFQRFEKFIQKHEDSIVDGAVKIIQSGINKLYTGIINRPHFNVEFHNGCYKDVLEKREYMRISLDEKKIASSIENRIQ